MNRCSLLIAGLMLFAAATGRGQEPGPRESAAAGESLEDWEYFQTLQLPELGSAKYVDFLVTPSVFDKARDDLADLRLYDGHNREVPFSLRIRRDEKRQEALPAREFNQTTNPDGSAELSLDLGELGVEHNEIEISPTGENFRRRVQVEGSDNGKDWRVLVGGEQRFVIDFQADGQRLSVRRFRYPLSRFRYLKVRLYPDGGLKNDRPGIAGVTVFHSVNIPGEYLTQEALLGMREPVPAQGGPGSAWVITIPGGRAPIEELLFEVEDADFRRPYQLETSDVLEGDDWTWVTQGEWRRRADQPRRPMTIRLPQMGPALPRRLRLTVTDFRNPPLDLRQVEFRAPVRQVVFARPPAGAEPLRLYFGNPRAILPNYDFAANLPVDLSPAPVRASLVPPPQPNPDWRPEPKPWTERWPGLVYVVLAGASLVLLSLLGLLAREAIHRHDQAEQPADAGVGAASGE
jgi:hypothetical protein